MDNLEKMGFDKFLNKKSPGETNQVTDDDISLQFPSIRQRGQGHEVSKNNRLTIDYKKGEIFTHVADRKLADFGALDGIDSQQGFRLNDSTGNLRFEVSMDKIYLGVGGQTQVSVETNTSITSVQTAINLVHERGGGQVFLPIGEYSETDNLTLYDNVSIVGEDRDLVIINLNGSTGFKGTGLTAVAFKNLTLTGTSGTAIYLNNVNKINIENVFFSGNTTDINLISCSVTTVKNCITTASSNFITLDDGVDARIYENTIDSLTGTAITISNSTIFNINNNVFEDNETGGIYVTDSNTGLVSANSLSSAGGNQMSFYSATQSDLSWINIKDNVYVLTGDNGIALSTTNLWECNVVGNIVDGPGSTSSGFSLANADRVTFSNNIATDLNIGCTFGVTCDRCVITSNIFLNNGTNLVNSATNSQTANNITA